MTECRFKINYEGGRNCSPSHKKRSIIMWKTTKTLLAFLSPGIFIFTIGFKEFRWIGILVAIYAILTIICTVIDYAKH